MAEACEVAAWLKALPCAPEFRPSEAEFADPIAYISKIEPEARTYGICKIVPPYSRASKKTVMANLNRSLLLQSPDSTSSAAAHGTPAFEPELCRNMGGCMPPHVRRHGRTGCCAPSQPRTRSMPLPSTSEMGDLKARFNTRRQQLGCSPGKRSKVSMQALAQKLVWQSGESYTLEQFEAKAKQFTRARLKTSRDLPPFIIESLFWKAAADRTITVEYGNDIPGSAFGEPSQQAIVPPTLYTKRKRGFKEDDYVQSSRKEPKLEVKEEDLGPKQEINDSTTTHRSLEEPALSSDTCSRQTPSYPSLPFLAKERARPHRKNGPADGEGKAGLKLSNSCWNMKVMARSPGSLLRYMPDEVPGVTSPMVYIGMLFSWFAWHVEDHELHSLNYLHTGAPKTWYAVPGDAAPALEEVVRVYGYGNISDPKAAFALLGEKTTVMSPEVLLAAGVPCCRLVQNAGEFVVTFPRAYHLGFSHGFNCGEAANFASPAWLEVAKEAATRRAAMDYLPMLSHQQLLYLLALSICPRVPDSLAFEAQRSEGKDSVYSLQEDPIKTVFINDVAHNHRLLGLLVDSGVTGCVLLGDDADLTLALSEHHKEISCFGVDNNLKISSMVMCETKTLKKDVAASPEEQDFFYALAETRNTSSMTHSSFRWGILPCAACGLLCFPSMAVVQPLSSIDNGLYPTKHLDIGAYGSLAPFFMEEEDYAPEISHLLPLQNDEESQSEFLKTSLTEAVCHPVASPLHLKPEQEEFLQWEPEQDAIQALHKDSQDAETLRRCWKDATYEVGRQNNHPCSNGKLLDHLQADFEKPNVLQQDIENMQDCINNCEEEMPRKAVKTQDSSELGSNKIGSVMLVAADRHRVSSGCIGPPHFLNADELVISNSGILENIAEDCPIAAGNGSSKPCSSGLIFQNCKASPVSDSLPLSDEVGATGDRNTEHDAATSVLQLLAVTYQDESEDSGLRDSNAKFVVVESDQRGTCFHPHSSLVSNDEVGCTADAPWHCVKEEIDCAPSVGCIDKLLTDNSNTGTPLNELDKFVREEVLLQSDDGTYVTTEGTPEVEGGLLVHSEQNRQLQLSKCEFEGVSTGLEMVSILPGCREGKSALHLENGQYCLEERESFADSEKVSHVESQIVNLPTFSKMDSDGKYMKAIFSTPMMKTSAMSEENGKNLKDTCPELAINRSSCHESRMQPNNSRRESNHVIPCGMGSTSVNESMRVGCQFVTDEVDKAENQIAADRNDHRTMCKDSSAVKECSSPDHVKSRSHAQHEPIIPVANYGISLNCRQGEQRDQSMSSLVEARATSDVGNERLIRGQDNGMERGPYAEKLTASASIGEPFCNARSDNPPGFSSSSILPSPHFLCLEHALEARHQLELLGGSNMVIICHSDISKIEGHAQHFEKELNLSHSWRSIPFKEANQEEKSLIKIALNIEEEGEDCSNDWVVHLGMSVRHCRDKVWSYHSKCSYNKHGTDVRCKRKAGSVCNMGDVRGHHAVGKVSEDKNSVAGHWCGKVWMNNQAHPVLGGCHTAATPLQAFRPSGEDNAIDEKPSSSEQICTGDLMDAVEGIESCQAMNDVDTMPNSQCKSPPQRQNKKRKSIDQTGTSMKAESDFSVEECSVLKRRELAADTVTLDTSCLTSAIKKASISLNETADLDNPVTGKKFVTMESNMHAGTEMTNLKAGNDHVSDVTMVDHDGSDVDIWQDLDVGCYSQEVLSLDNLGGITDTLMVDNCHQMDPESQENLLIPPMLRRRPCSVFDGEAQSQSLGRERDCAVTVSAFAECSMGEVLHAALEPSMPEGLDYTTGLKRKQDSQIDITNRRGKERNFNPLDISNLSTADFRHNQQSIPFFEPSRNFNADLVGEENGRAECAHTDVISSGKLRVLHHDSKHGYACDSGQYSSAPPFNFLTRNLGRMNSDSSSGSTQWRLHTAQNLSPLVKCNSKKLGGKNGRKLKKQLNWEKSRKDALNQSLHATTESSEDDMVQKKTLSKGRKKATLDDLPFDCADYLIEGPSTRLRSRRVAKVLSMDDEDVATGRHDDGMVSRGKKHKEPRQKAKKQVLKDVEDEGGAYICDLDGCSMSFISRQELNLHKKNACTFTGCGKRFGSHKYLLQHKRVHMDDRPLKCPWSGCKMTFKWKWACTEHYRVHTGERPYVCPIPECGRTFRFVSDFSRHKRKTGHTK